jgi:hypothetical protein
MRLPNETANTVASTVYAGTVEKLWVTNIRRTIAPAVSKFQAAGNNLLSRVVVVMLSW